MRASRGGKGSDLSRFPMAVMWPRPSSASNSISSSRAAAMAAAGGGSIQGSESGSAVPHSANRAARVQDGRAVWGSANGGRLCVCSSSHSRKQTPGSVRPARPRRWSAAARDTRTVSSRVTPASGSKRGTRARPLSMTARTPSMVIDVSAIEVARTTLRWPLDAGASARSCARASMAP